jgi:flagellar hook-associated protein 1 FlgK
MSDLGSSLRIGLSGLSAAQDGISVVGHNIANVNTPGYSRQSAIQSTNPSQNLGNVLYGTGVTVTAVQALRNQFLNLQVSSSTSAQAGAQTRYTGIQAVASAFQDDGTTGINTQLQQFFTSLSTLATTPEDVSARTNVIGRAQSLLTELKSTYQTVTSQISASDQQVAALVPQVNTLCKQIADLNAQISQQVNPQSANDAIDQRQQLTDQLSKLVGVQVSTDSQNNYLVTLDSGAATLVSGRTAYTMSTTPNAANSNYLDVTVAAGATTVNVTGQIKNGQLGGYLDLRDSILPQYQTQLDQIAGSLAGQVNQINMTGFSLPNAAGVSTTGTLFFTGGNGVSSGINPATGLAYTAAGVPNYKGMINALQVNPLVTATPGLIAASSVSGAAGNNGNALKLAALQTSLNAVDVQGNGSFSSGPFSTVVSGLINNVGTQSQGFETTATNQENLLTALQAQKASQSGVSLDEEAGSLLAFQQAYQASAQFITTISKLTDQLMAMANA